jgi:hypothetical protein
MYSFGKPTVDPINVEVQSIINTLNKGNDFTHKVVTSERGDTKKHRTFMLVANELRKRGLKVDHTQNWHQTEWVIKI